MVEWSAAGGGEEKARREYQALKKQREEEHKEALRMEVAKGEEARKVAADLTEQVAALKKQMAELAAQNLALQEAAKSGVIAEQKLVETQQQLNQQTADFEAHKKKAVASDEVLGLKKTMEEAQARAAQLEVQIAVERKLNAELEAKLTLSHDELMALQEEDDGDDENVEQRLTVMLTRDEQTGTLGADLHVWQEKVSHLESRIEQPTETMRQAAYVDALGMRDAARKLAC